MPEQEAMKAVADYLRALYQPGDVFEIRVPGSPRAVRGWSFEEIDVSKAMCASGSRGKNDVRATELLIHNVQSGLFAAL